MKRDNQIVAWDRQEAIADMRTMIKIMSNDKKIIDALAVLEEHSIEFDNTRAEHLVARSSDIFDLMVSPRRELRNIIDEEQMSTMIKSSVTRERGVIKVAR